jgi:hypothetical protein
MELENREYDYKDPSRWPRDTLCPQKFALTSLTIGGRSVGIVRSRTKASELLVIIMGPKGAPTPRRTGRHTVGPI